MIINVIFYYKFKKITHMDTAEYVPQTGSSYWCTFPVTLYYPKYTLGIFESAYQAALTQMTSTIN